MSLEPYAVYLTPPMLADDRPLRFNTHHAMVIEIYVPESHTNVKCFRFSSSSREKGTMRNSREGLPGARSQEPPFPAIMRGTAFYYR